MQVLFEETQRIVLQFLQEEYSRAPSTRGLKEIQEAKKHIPQLQEQLSKATGCSQVTQAQLAWGGLPGTALELLGQAGLRFGAGTAHPSRIVQQALSSSLKNLLLRTSASSDVFVICQWNLKYIHDVILGSFKQFCFHF